MEAGLAGGRQQAVRAPMRKDALANQYKIFWLSKIIYAFQ
jgi:hypothetical protein